MTAKGEAQVKAESVFMKALKEGRKGREEESGRIRRKRIGRTAPQLQWDVEE